ncbi:MAG: nucleotide pyrophosphohydrolase [Rubripirellula sp.]|jgi:NTP pyrophosphatase (non-canonical NTP hydrolase)|nr:nucleotide pyrophosphohydrolase [Planctomycetaceae bacterium]MDF1842889.1 nucleotide pyrophosphohydrolase [Rubripirellula sp.]
MRKTSVESNDRTTTISDLKTAVATFAEERDWEQFHDPKNLVMAMVSEIGELSEHFRWVRSEEAFATAADPANAEDIAHELADILMFALEFANVCDIDIAKAVSSKIEINRQRYPIEKAKGRSDKYNRLDDSSSQ